MHLNHTKNKEGLILTNETRVLHRWKEYIREVLTAENYEPEENTNNADTVEEEETDSNEPR